MSLALEPIEEIRHRDKIIAAVREYAVSYDDHIRKELLEILEGEA